MDLSHYRILADLFAYPDATFAVRIARVRELVADAYPKAAAILAPFFAALPMDDLPALQELFIRSFDVQSITTLDVGYVLFGDDYKRGELLANLSREHREAGNDCGRELGDHLPNMLRLLPVVADAELREELVQELIAPALREMSREFDPVRLASKDKMYKKHHKTLIEAPDNTRTIYRAALEAVLEVLDADFQLIDRPLIKQTSSFLPMVKAEMKLDPLQ